MGSYIIRRLLWIPITVIAVSILVFLMVRFIPGNIVDLIIAQSSQGNVDVVADRLAVMHAFGLDVPVYVQYVHWVGNLVLHGSLGISMWDNTNITSDIMQSLPVTMELGIMAILVGHIISIPIGVYSAIRQDTIQTIYYVASLSSLSLSPPSGSER